MWAWLRGLWGEPKAPESDDTETLDETPSHPYRTASGGGVPVKVTDSILPEEDLSLLGILKGAVEEVAEEQAKIEQKYLTDEKMKVYFQKSIKFVISKLDADSYDFVLVHASDAGVDQNAFGVFAQIFAKACAQLGIQTEVENSYVTVCKPSVRKLIKTIPTITPRVSVEDKVRAMLGR